MDDAQGSDNQVTPNQAGLGLVDEVRSYLEGLKPRDLAETLIGGLSTQEFPEYVGGEMLELVRDAAGVTEYFLAPLLERSSYRPGSKKSTLDLRKDKGGLVATVGEALGINMRGVERRPSPRS